jgi:hypothetical protein
MAFVKIGRPLAVQSTSRMSPATGSRSREPSAPTTPIELDAFDAAGIMR